MTDSTTTSVGGFTVGDHVRLREDADPRAYGRIRGVRFADGVIDRLDGSWSTGESIRVRDGVRDDGPRDGDWYWYAPDELELVDGEVGPMTVASHVDALEEELDQATCRALLEAYDALPHDADGKVLRVGDRVMLAPGVEGDCDAHYGMRAGDVLRVSDTHHTTFYPIKLTDGRLECYVRPEELVHAPADEDAPDAFEQDAPEEQPEPTADVPHGLAGLRKLPEGCHWPTYADGTPVEIGDRYVSSSGDVRTVEYVAVAIGASALCAQDLDDDLYEPGECVRRPAPADTWDQLREDATLPPASYCDRHDVNLDDGWEPSDAVQAMALDLIERAERLARGDE